MSDDLNWHVAMVSRPGLERPARVGLYARGFDVHVPTEYDQLETRERKHIIANTLLISPYFFVLFHTHDQDEHALVLAERGVKHVLLARGQSDETTWHPSPVPSRLVRQSIAREYEEQHNATKKREKDDHGLQLGKEYKIIRGHAEGTLTTLISVDRDTVLLACGSVLLRKSAFDIMLVAEKKRAA